MGGIYFICDGEVAETPFCCVFEWLYYCCSVSCGSRGFLGNVEVIFPSSFTADASVHLSPSSA